MNNYYVYRITDQKNGEFYIGSRTAAHEIKPRNDDYMGSPSYGWENPEHLEKEILMIFNKWSRQQVLDFEYDLIDDFFEHPKNVNAANPKKGFYCDNSGTVTVKNKNGVYLKVDTGDPRYLSGELKGTTASNTEEFIQKANSVHNFKYVYLLTNYINNATKVRIICPKHGLFWQTPREHLRPHGCAKCGGKLPIKVRNIKTGIIYPSLHEASRNHRDSAPTIGRHCKNEITINPRWEYISKQPKKD